MNSLDADECAFCGDCRLGEVFKLDNEANFLNSVFEEEDAISNENTTVVTKSNLEVFMSRNVNYKEKYAKSHPTKYRRLKREVWIVNPELVAQRKQTSAQNPTEVKFYEIMPNNLIDIKCVESVEVLKVHASISHPESMGLACDQCEQKFKSGSKLQEHITTDNENNDRNIMNYLCDRCGNRLNDISFIDKNKGNTEKFMVDYKLCVEKL